MELPAIRPGILEQLLGDAPRPGTVDENRLAVDDPPAQPGPDGWTPTSVRYVVSREKEGILSSQLRAAVAPIDDVPGQRLTTGMIDQLAPYFAAEFHVDEQLVRTELAKVYLYVGGPAANIPNTAVTVGRHIYVPTREDLDRMVSPGYRGWLVHELGHTMQFVAYSAGNEYKSLSSYLGAILVGSNPSQPGVGSGPLTWGSLFTGLTLLQRPQTKAQEPTNNDADRRMFELWAPLAVGVPTGLVAAGALDATRRIIAGPAGRIPHPVASVLTGFAAVSAPALAGSLAGAAALRSDLDPRLLGAVAGGGTALAGLGALAAFGTGGGIGKGLLLGGTLLGAATGAATGSITANTLRGWSRDSEIIRARRGDFHPKDLADAMHEANWLEVDAEAGAQLYTAQPAGTTNDASAWNGVTPQAQQNLASKLDFALVVPTIIGVPAAAAAGTGVLALRAIGLGTKSLPATGGGGLLGRVGSSVQAAAANRGVLNSYAVGASMTLAPLIVGGAVGSLAGETMESPTHAKLVGTAASIATTGVLMTLLLQGRNQGKLVGQAGRIAVGMAIAGVFGLVASGAAVNAGRQSIRRYDIGATAPSA